MSPVFSKSKNVRSHATLKCSHFSKISINLGAKASIISTTTEHQLHPKHLTHLFQQLCRRVRTEVSPTIPTTRQCCQQVNARTGEEPGDPSPVTRASGRSPVSVTVTAQNCQEGGTGLLRRRARAWGQPQLGGEHSPLEALRAHALLQLRTVPVTGMYT